MRQGRLDAAGDPDSEAGLTYYSTGDGNDYTGEGLYDDAPGDIVDYPWAYPEHPLFRKIYEEKFGRTAPVEEPKPFATSVLSETGSRSLDDSSVEAFVSRVSDATKAKEKLDSSAQDALETIKKELTASFVDAQRQGFIPFIREAQVQQAVSSAQSDILKSFIDQFRQQQQQEKI